MKKSTKIMFVLLLFVAIGTRAAMAELPPDLPYTDHLPTLPAFAAFKSDDSNSADPDQIRPAEKLIDKNPVSHLVAAYARLFGSALSVSRISQNRYWSGLMDSGNSAVAATTGIIGDTVDDLARTIDVARAHEKGFVYNPAILQCTGALPVTGAQYLGGLAAVTQLKHTWLQLNQRTYGMPYTLNKTFFGGDAVITSPDGFQWESLQDVACVPVLQPETETQFDFEKKFSCIIDKASTAQLGTQTRQLILSYSAFKENCLGAVRFVTECAGGKISQTPNLDVGGRLSPTQEAKFRYKDAAIMSAYDEIFRAFEALDQALAQAQKADSRLTAQQFIQGQAPLLAQVEKSLKQASQLIEKNYPQAVTGDFVYRGGVHIQEHWLRYVVDIWPNELKDLKDFDRFSDFLFWIVQKASTDFPAVAETTVEGACQQLRSECDAGGEQ